MSDTPLNDLVARQYESWPYPEPLGDLGKPAPNSYLFYFPKRAYWEGINILVAGCGPNQAAKVALADRNAHVVGIDVSDASLANEQRLKARYSLANLDVHRLPIE